MARIFLSPAGTLSDGTARQWNAGSVQYTEPVGGTVSVFDATHGHSAEEATVSFNATVTPADTTHGHSVDAVDVGAGQYTVTANDATHGHTAEQPSITSTSAILVNDATHGHSAEGPTLTYTTLVTINDATHAQRARSVRVGSFFFRKDDRPPNIPQA